jgi:hypothetical protein
MTRNIRRATVKKLISVAAFWCLISWVGAGAAQTQDQGVKFTLGPEWKVANKANDNSSGIVEFVREGDNIHNWKELVTIQTFKESAKSSPQEVLMRLKALREKECPGATEWNIIEQSENTLSYEWHAKPCLGWPEQQEIARIIFVRPYSCILRYTAKVHELAPEIRTGWIKTFADATFDPNTSAFDAPSTTPQEIARELSANWGQNPAPDARLVLKEAARKNGRRGTAITYHAESSGFPTGKTYSLWILQSGDHKALPLLQGYLANATGTLVCPGQSKPGDPPDRSVHCFPLERASLDVDNYHNGEPVDFAIVSTDGTVRAYARAYPFPIQAQDGKCALHVEIDNSKFTTFVIRGEGFEPNENIKTSSSFGKDATEGTQQASPQGEFAATIHADLPGKNSGTATFTATGNSCHPTVTYEWGKAAMKVQ